MKSITIKNLKDYGGFRNTFQLRNNGQLTISASIKEKVNNSYKTRVREFCRAWTMDKKSTMALRDFLNKELESVKE